MKNLKFILTCLLVSLIAITLILPTKVLALNESSTNEKVKIVYTENGDYIIYVNELSEGDTAFSYAISENAEAAQQEEYKESVLDQEGNQVAIITAYRYETIKEKNNYLYVKSGEELVINAQLLDFSEAFSQSNMKIVEGTTKRINTEISSFKEEETVDGVKKTLVVGVLNIVDDENAVYSYESTKLPSEEYTELMILAEKINDEYETMTMFARIELAQQFYDLYEKLIPTDSWIEVEDMKILQPEDAQDGDQYVVFLKKVDANNEETIDVKFLTSFREDSEEKIPETTQTITKTVNETAKLPVTYDSMVLFILLAVIVVALVVVFVRMKKIQNKGKND